jgi:hypothetical protein
MANIIEGIQQEVVRCRELLKQYEAIPQGAFGAIMIKQTIAEAESAVAHGDTVEMIRKYQELKEIK